MTYHQQNMASPLRGGLTGVRNDLLTDRLYNYLQPQIQQQRSQLRLQIQPPQPIQPPHRAQRIKARPRVVKPKEEPQISDMIKRKKKGKIIRVNISTIIFVLIVVIILTIILMINK